MFPSQSYLIILSRILERAGYYGFRSIIMVYLLTGPVQMDAKTAFPLFTLLITISYLATPIGGLLGDLVLGSKKAAIAGAIIMAIGTAFICFPNPDLIYTSIILVGFGSGLYSSNTIALFAKTYSQQPAKLDSGFTLFYVAVNIGALIGSVFMASQGVNYFKSAFIGSGILILLSLIPLAFVRDKTSENNTPPLQTNYQSIFVLPAILLIVFYWTFYGNGFDGIISKTLHMQSLISTSEFLSDNLDAILNLAGIFVLGILFTLLWMYVKINPFIKLALGFLTAGLSFTCLMFIPDNATEAYLPVYFLFVLLICISELLVAPITMSLIAKYSNPRFYALVFSAYIAGNWLFSKLLNTSTASQDSLFISEANTFISAILPLLLTGIIILIITLVTQKKESQL